ncbi:hypothetical protein EOS_31000 [Caballeronia mineralivorans PML1(12)]|uniref:Uncharacterized protein n=1 Tax=Caballeronia mineralivorans PML1(12) TaxID=908627 RepID=A0A0J1CNX3_9BURK|nr:hypothetical protein EOS_31000 [Caballeronia mineralivorans PML1(12)]
MTILKNAALNGCDAGFGSSERPLSVNDPQGLFHTHVGVLTPARHRRRADLRFRHDVVQVAQAPAFVCTIPHERMITKMVVVVRHKDVEHHAFEQVSRQSCPFMGRKDRRRTEGSRLLPGINRMS